MTSGEFVAEDWIDRLAPALARLAEAQEPFLQESYRHTPRVYVVHDVRNSNRRAFPLGDAGALYALARYSTRFGEEEYYAPLREALDPVRYVLLSHPTLAWVVGRIIGRDEFWMQILNSGRSVRPTDLIAGLMARAAELSSDRFRAAAVELKGTSKNW